MLLQNALPSICLGVLSSKLSRFVVVQGEFVSCLVNWNEFSLNRNCAVIEQSILMLFYLRPMDENM